MIRGHPARDFAGKSLVCVLISLMSASYQLAISQSLCSSSSFSVSIDFMGGNIAACDIESDNRITAWIMPEDPPPINHSPWFALQIDTNYAQTVRLVLDYGAAHHRYPPKIRRLGGVWQPISSDLIELSTDKTRATLLLELTAQASFQIAAQPLMVTSDYKDWLEQIDSKSDVTVTSVGVTPELRPLYRFITEPREETLLVLGRQHPPETTGATALRAFVERLLEADELAGKFRSRVMILGYPLVNPDGVDRGHWRHNTRGADLNRDWGPFQQVENQLIIQDIVAVLDEKKSGLIKALDFHSTLYDVMYTQPDNTAKVRPSLLGDWMIEFDSKMRGLSTGFELRREDSYNPEGTTAKTFFFQKYGVASTTFEIGDNTPNDFIELYARTAAETLMSVWLQSL